MQFRTACTSPKNAETEPPYIAFETFHKRQITWVDLPKLDKFTHIANKHERITGEIHP